MRYVDIRWTIPFLASTLYVATVLLRQGFQCWGSWFAPLFCILPHEKTFTALIRRCQSHSGLAAWMDGWMDDGTGWSGLALMNALQSTTYGCSEALPGEAELLVYVVRC